MGVKREAQRLIDKVHDACQSSISDSNRKGNYHVSISIRMAGDIPFVEQTVLRSDMGRETVSYYNYSLYNNSPWFIGRAVKRTVEMVRYVADRLRSEGMDVDMMFFSHRNGKYIKRNSLYCF